MHVRVKLLVPFYFGVYVVLVFAQISYTKLSQSNIEYPFDLLYAYDAPNFEAARNSKQIILNLIRLCN